MDKWDSWRLFNVIHDILQSDYYLFLVMCWARFKPEAEPGLACLSPAQPGPCCGLCAGWAGLHISQAQSPGSGPGFQPIYITYVSSCHAAQPDRPATGCVGIEISFFCRSCLVTSSHAARPYGPTCHTCATLALRLVYISTNHASLLPLWRTGTYDCAAWLLVTRPNTKNCDKYYWKKFWTVFCLLLQWQKVYK